MRRWIRAHIALLDAKGTSTVLDNTSKAANDILKRVIQIAEESIPSSAENIALAVGAFCMVLPPSAHAVKSTASKFLLNWLFQYEHEYRQWSAAISLGAISSCLHVTDHKQKFQSINALLEVASISKSTLVKGACGLGLGFSSQDLLTRVEVEDNSKMQEIDLLGRIVTALSRMLCQFTRSSSDVLELQSLSSNIFQKTDAIDSDLLYNNYDDLEEDIWGVAGLVLGLGSSVSAVYRTGNLDSVLKIKTLITSWIPLVNPLVQNSATGEKLEIALSLGSFLALPIIVDFLQRVEMLDDSELDYLISGSRKFISELLSINKSGAFHQSLLIASCTGVANLIACILNEGVHSVHVEHVKDLLMLFKKSYSSSYPPLVHLGGMLGVVNILGAGAGILFRHYSLTSLHHAYDSKESSIITGPLLSSPVMEPNLMSLIQDMFLVSQNPDDHQLQQYAAWAVSFLRHYLWFKEVRNEESNFRSDAIGSKSVSHSFPGDSLVMKLSTWLMLHNYPGTGTAAHVNTVATALRCLTKAPILPMLDWGAIIRRCMRYEDQVTELLPSDSALRRGVLREECLKFSLAHANQFDPLLSFLDEISDLSRFRTLELNLQSCMLSHLKDMTKIFSGSRIEKLFDDVANFIHWLVSSNQLYNQQQKSLLRVSCWKGLTLCFNGTSIDFEDYIPNLENCMKVLFCSLPASLNSATIGVSQDHVLEEWSEAIRGLEKARQGWLIDLLQVFEVDFEDRSVDFLEVKKKSQAMARLVQTGSIPLSELGKLKGYMLNTSSQDSWDILLEVADTLQHTEGSIKRQWLLDVAEISCVTRYPSTALQFLGLLCGSFSKYMPFLVVDRFTVLCDLPVTLASLLSETSWKVVAESVVSLLWTLTERIHDWATHTERANDLVIPQSIDKSEDDNAAFLLQLMHQACVSLKDYLPTEKQLRLANMFIPLTATV